MSDRKPLLNDKFEEAGLYERLVNDSIQVSKLYPLVGRCDSMMKRYGGWWWIKGDGNQRIKIATLNRILTPGEFKKVAEYLSRKWTKEQSPGCNFYFNVSNGSIPYDTRLAEMVSRIDADSVENCLINGMELEAEEVPSHMAVRAKLIDMINNGEVITRQDTIIVAKVVKDFKGDVIQSEDRGFNVDGAFRARFYGIEFTPWREWLGMKVELGSRVLYGDAMVVAACLWEMTFIDTDEDVIQTSLLDLENLMGEVSQ